MTFLKNIRIDVVAIAVLVLTAIGVIFFQFVEIPTNLHFDEVEFAKLALSLKDTSYTPYSPLATGHATMYFYIILASLNMFGLNTFALRLPAAVFGVLGVVVFYFIMKKVFEKKEWGEVMPFLLSFIFITMRWYVNFARFSFEATLLIFLEFMSILFFFLYRKDKRLWLIALSGVFAGLAYNSYTPGRLFFSIPLFFLLLELRPKDVLKFNFEKLRPVLTFVVSFAIFILPLTIYLSQNTDIRVYQQFFVMSDKLSIVEKADYLTQNIVNTAKMFHFKGDVNGVHNFPNKPALNPILGVLFVIGLMLSFKNWRKFYNQFFLIYFGLSILPTILTYPWENPHMLRTVTAIPSIVYFCGIVMVFILKTLPYKRFVLAGLIVLILLSSAYELRTYFVYQSIVFEDAFRLRQDLQHYIDNPDYIDPGAM